MRCYVCCLMVAIMGMAFIACAHAGEEQLAPGMTERDVAGIMGPPNFVRLERNGVQCLVYQPSERRFTNLIFIRDALIVAFRLGHLATVDSVYASEIDSHCSQIAAAWDLPPQHPETCFRKFWLRCEP
jgi:hypothetical protein